MLTKIRVRLSGVRFLVVCSLWAHPTSYSVGTRGYFSMGNVCHDSRSPLLREQVKKVFVQHCLIVEHMTFLLLVVLTTNQEGGCLNTPSPGAQLSTVYETKHEFVRNTSARKGEIGRMLKDL
jgi:hypothetical protein